MEKMVCKTDRASLVKAVSILQWYPENAQKNIMGITHLLSDRELMLHIMKYAKDAGFEVVWEGKMPESDRSWG